MHGTRVSTGRKPRKRGRERGGVWGPALRRQSARGQERTNHTRKVLGLLQGNPGRALSGRSTVEWEGERAIRHRPRGATGTCAERTRASQEDGHAPPSSVGLAVCVCVGVHAHRRMDMAGRRQRLVSKDHRGGARQAKARASGLPTPGGRQRGPRTTYFSMRFFCVEVMRFSGGRSFWAFFFCCSCLTEVWQGRGAAGGQ